MSTQTHKYSTIHCDGCGATHGEVGQYPDVKTARQAALDQGWKLIPKVKGSGKPTQMSLTDPKFLERASVWTTDACPLCAPTIQPEALARKSQSPWWQERIERLEKENATLRATPS